MAACPFSALVLIAPKLVEYLSHCFIQKLPVGDIFNLMQTCKKMAAFCSSQSLWKHLLDRDYHLSVSLTDHETERDFHAYYQELYSTPFIKGVGVRLTCSRESVSSGSRAVFTTTIFNNNDHAVKAQNQQPLHAHRYEAASSFMSAWEHEDNKLYLNSASPSYGTCKKSGKSISLLPSSVESELATREIPPHSRTEFSVVGILSEQAGLKMSRGNEEDSLFMTFPSHHLKVADNQVDQFWMRTKVSFDSTELYSNIVNIHISGERRNSNPFSGAA